MFENFYQGKRVFITGHTGFKGSWLMTWLHQLRAEVAGFSLDIPTSPNHFELLNLKEKIRDFRGDIRDQRALEAAISEFKPEIIFHLAAQPIVRKSYEDPSETFSTNVMGMVNLLEVTRRHSFIKAAVLITSDKAYKNVEWPWGYRETDILGGKDPYSSSKACAELVAYSYFQSYFRNSGQKIVTTRAGNVIGGGDWAADRIIPDAIRAVSNDTVVTIRNPAATRPWQHVLEPLSGYLWLGAKLLSGGADLNGESFNFGPDADVNESVEELLSAMRQLWPKIQWQVPEASQAQVAEANLLKLSCDKALMALRWKAVMKFPETVQFTTDWYRNWFSGKVPIREFTEQQIDSYVSIARSKKISWTN